MMKNYEVKKYTGNWNEIPALKVDEVLWSGDSGIRMVQKTAYDEEAIYVYQRAEEKEIRAVETDRLASVCNDSCMEFFFSPGCDRRYFNFEMNSLGTCYIGFGAERERRIRIVPEDITDFKIHTKMLKDGWELTYRIPVGFIRFFYPDFVLKPGVRFTANCYKCGDMTVQRHYLAWNPVVWKNPDFHRPEFFGEMIFA